jgi:hypothetical protein
MERDQGETIKPVPGDPSHVGRRGSNAPRITTNSDGVPTLVTEGMDMMGDLGTRLNIESVPLAQQAPKALSGGLALLNLPTR